MAQAIFSGDTVYLTFLCFNDPSGGFLFTTPVPELEELRTPGVDGKRHRTLSHQFGIVPAQTLAEATNYAAAVTLCNSYRDAVGSYLNVNVTVGGTILTFKNVYVSGVDPKPRAGQPVGAGASVSSTAHVVALWSLELTEFPSSGTE